MGARRVDTADPDDGNRDRIANASQLIHGDVDGIGLGRRRVQGAHAQVIRTGGLGCERLVHRLGAYAHDGLLAQDAAGLRTGHIGLAHMHAVGSHLRRKCHVDHERDARLGAHRLELPGKKCHLVMARVLLTKLDEGDTALDGLTHAVGKATAPQPSAVGHGVEQHRAADILGRPPAAGAGDAFLCGNHYATFCTRAPAASFSPVML